jgi:hypothetical protein
MSILHVTQISKKITELFESHLDLSDLGVNDAQRQVKVLTRCLAAYAVHFSTGCSENEAAIAVVDGGDDNGIDAIHYSPSLKQMTIVQSKFKQSGTGEPESGEIAKFCQGIKDLFNLNFDRFNNKVAVKQPQIEQALGEFDTRYELILIDTGNQGLAVHSQRLIDDLLTEMNDAGEDTQDQLVNYVRLNQSKIHSSLAASAGTVPIDLEIGLSQWGKTTEPHVAFFGMVSAEEISAWWGNYGRKLFEKNIRQVLGVTEVNDEMKDTLSNYPENFWYFNNGITIVCDRVEKSMIGGSSRDTGAFKLYGAQIVNGAQTVSTIGKFHSTNDNALQSVMVSARIISLEHAGSGFGAAVTRANNRQNRIENRDFVSQDPEQMRIRTELSIDGIDYNLVRSDSFKSTQSSFDLSEATAALACASGKTNLAVQAKREIGKYFENLNGGIYKAIFNPSVSGTYVWNCVLATREIEKALLNRVSELSKRSGREYGLLIHGNRIITMMVMNKLELRNKALKPDFSMDEADIESTVNEVVTMLRGQLENDFPDAMMGTLFKNQTKCRSLVQSCV